MKTVLLFIAAAILLGIAGAYAISVWLSLEGVDVPFWVNVALAGGIAVSLGLWAGLIRLSYISSKRGYDDAAGRYTHPDED